MYLFHFLFGYFTLVQDIVLIMGGKVHSMITGINFIYELFSIQLFITYFNDPSHYLYIEYLFVGFDKISGFKEKIWTLIKLIIDH